MNILVIGAGAVGLVYGRHLQLGGARVSFLVRAKHAGEHADGFTLYPLRSKGKYEPVRFRPERILTSLKDVEKESFDQVWICVPTTALVKPWIDEVVAASGDATLVLFPAGIDVVERLGLPADRCVVGLIAMMSYFAPMEGESLAEPGVAYWFPPLSPTVLGGEKTRRDAVIAALKRGKCPAAARANVRQAAAFGSAILIPHIIALEGADWSYDRLSRGHWLADSVASTREALAVAAAHLKVSRPFVAALLRPWTVRLILRILRLFAPMDVAAFFKMHFMKVHDQTKVQIGEYIKLGAKNGQPVAALAKLTEDVFGAGWNRQLPPATRDD